MPGDDWDRHWDEYAESAEQNPAQRMRRQIILSRLGNLPPRARILDIGCGQGDLIAALHRRFPEAEVRGIDVSEAGIRVARAKVPTASFIQRDLVQDPETPDGMRRWASQAICSEVLEHVDDPLRLLQNASGYLAPGCRLVVTVPGGPMSAFDHHIGHRKHFTRSALQALLLRAGFREVRVDGAGFPFFNLYRLVVIQRGQKLVTEVARGDGGSGSMAARLAMRLFRWLFAFNLPAGGWGWQIVAQARHPEDSTSSDA